MATLNLEPAISTRYRIERVMYDVPWSMWYRNGLAHCSTANSARATESAWSLAYGDARRESECWRVSSTARSEQIFVVYRLIDLMSSSSIGHIK